MRIIDYVEKSHVRRIQVEPKVFCSSLNIIKYLYLPNLNKQAIYIAI